MKRKNILWVFMMTLLLSLVPFTYVSAEAADETGIIYGDGNLTRAEWLHNLTVMFDITVEEDNMPDDYFTDVTPDHAYYKDIMMAAEFGIIDIEAGENVEPDAVTTREFAAHTLNYCLGYKLDDTTYTYSDAAEVTWQEDAQIAINRGWFALENGNFVPDKAVTGEEVKTMEADVESVQASTVIDADYDNEYTFAKNVIEVPEGTEVAIDEQENVTIVDCPVTIVQGNTFAVYVDGTAQVYTAKEVTVSGADTVIVTQEADFSKAVEDVDAQGTEVGDLSEAEAIGDTEIIYIEGGTEAQAYEDGKMYKSARIAGTKNIDAIKASKTIKLSSGASFTITCTLSEVSVDYKVSIADGEVYVKANGDATFTGTVSTGSMGNGSIDLVNIPVAYVGVIKVSVDYSVSGEVTLSYTTGFRTGIQYSNSGGFRLVKNFQKKSFTIQSRTELSAGVTASVGLTKLPVVSGNLYAKMGAKTQMLSKTFNDGKTPNTCMTVSSWMYASVGANAGLDFGFTKKTFSQSYDIYNLQNSPVRVVYHFEDGKLTYPCTRNWEYANGYFTRWNSRYGSAWGGYGLDDSGNLVPVFTYTTDNDGNATITGYTGYASALVIPSEIDGHTVVAIGNRAFENRGELYSVVIPDTVTRIGDYAFAGTSLQELDLPDGLVYLGQYFLKGTDRVTEIEIPKTLEEVGTSYSGAPFAGSNVQKAILEKGIAEIPGYLFRGNETLHNVEIPESVTSIGTAAFSGCSSLTGVKIPEAVTNIGNHAFEQCFSIENIVIPNAVKNIGDWAFANMELTELELPDELVYLGQCFLEGTDGVTEIEIPKTLEEVGTSYSGAPFAGSNVQKAILEKGMTEIPGYLFRGNETLHSVEIPESVTSIGTAAFSGCSSLTGVKIPEAVTNIGNHAFEQCFSIENIVIPNAVKNIGDWAFANMELTELELPDELVYLGQCFLEGTDGVTEIEIPKTLEEVGTSYSGAPFAGSNVQKAILEKGMTEIPGYLFRGNETLHSVEIPESVTSIGTAAFSGCSSLTGVKIPEMVINIGNHAFEKCSSLKEIILPREVKKVSNHTFVNCTGLEKITWNNALSQIGEYAFENCDSLTDLTIPSTITEIQEGTFSDCDGLTKIQLPDSVTTIGERTFYNCDSLAAITIPDSVTSIGSSIFYDCDALTDVTLGTGITSIPSSAFEHCDVLQSIVLPYRTATVGANAFKNCVALTEITIPRATTSIDATAFSYPSKMTVYGVAGTYAETFANEQGMKFVNREVKATEVKLSQTELKLNRGVKEKLVMTVTPEDFTDEVTWRSSNTDVATIDDSGQVTAKAVGETTIKVTVGDVSASCKVTVVQPVTSISLNKSSLEMNALDTYQLKANVSPSNADNKSVQWSSSDATIASVDESGLVTAHKKGTAVITVAAQDGSGVTRSCNVTVKNSAHIVASPEELESPHNYENNCSDFWVYTQEGAEGLQVTFDARTNIEEDFDYLYIFRADGEQVGMYTGTELAGQTIYVPGDTVKIQLVSDNAGNEWGFKVSDITAGALQKLPQTIAGTASYEKMYGDEDFTLDTEVTQGDGSLSYRSEDENVVVVSGNGTVSIVGAGQTNIVVTASETDHYNKTEKKISVSVAKKTLTEEEVMQLDSRFDFHYGTAEEASVVDLRELLPENSGQVQFHPDVNIAGQEGLIFDTFVDENGRLSYQVNPGTLGEKAKLQVTVSSDNYEDFTLVVTVELICMHADESQYEIRNAKKADCTEDGYTGDVFCSICGQKVKDGTIIAPFGHQWDAGRVTQEPTADTDGVKTYTCERCGVTKTESIPAVSEPTDDTETPGGGTTTPGGGSQPGGTGTTPGSQNGGASGTGAGGQGSHTSGNTGSQQNTLRANAIARNSATGETCRIIQPGQTVEYLTAPNKKTVTVPDTIVINGVRHKVTSIANNAFKNNKKLKSVVIGKNITKIGKKAFFGCQNLKKITIKTTKLKAKTVGAKAFTKAGSKNYNKLTVKVPKKCKKLTRRF